MDPKSVTRGQKLEMYVKPNCPYCQQARDFYDAHGIDYTEFDAQNDPAARERMFALTGKDPTVPAIVVDGTYIQSGWGTPPHG